MTDLSDTHPLVLYSRGMISRHVAVERLSIRDYASLLIMLGDANLPMPMPMPTEEQIAAEVKTFRMLMRST